MNSNPAFFFEKISNSSKIGSIFDFAFVKKVLFSNGAQQTNWSEVNFIFNCDNSVAAGF